MTRRELIAAGALCAARAWARTHIDKFSISAITDEIGRSTDDSIAFAHQYGLKFVEIRSVPGTRKEYFSLTEPEIKVDAVRFVNEGLKVSFVNTSLMKFAWPGMQAARRRPEDAAAREKRLAMEKARWDGRMEDLAKAIRCAQIMGCDKVRVFTGSRVEDPSAQFQRIADNIGEMSLTAAREKVYLLIENEMSQNVATGAELAAILKLIPSKWVGCNWDPHNAYGRETAYPEGYDAVPKRRLLNIQIKAKGVMPSSPEKEDWKAIFEALERDGYKHKIGLETHIFDGTLIAAAHTSMDEILHIVSQL
ncbi:MAG: sugar phosphate isomerase/epimerase family protein [Bryobacteraceae bacterium]